MPFKEIKLGIAAVLVILNAGLLVGALLARAQQRPLGPWYFRGYALSHTLAALLVIMGLTFLGRGLTAPWMHILYGLLATVGTVGQLVLRPRTELGQQNKGRPLVHAVLSLFVLLAAGRAIFSVWTP